MPEPIHRSILVVDVEDSESLTNVQVEAVRTVLYHIIDDAIRGFESVVSQEDRGDGAMLVLDIPVLDVLDRIVGSMLTGLRDHNGAAGPMNWLRLRIAVHEGYVGRDDKGWSSDAVTATFRMNSAQLVKYALERAPRANAVVVVSDSVFSGLVRHRYRETVTPDEYASGTMSSKSGDRPIWVRVPGYPEPPLPPAESSVPGKTERRPDGPEPAGSGRERTTIHAKNFIGGNAVVGTQVGRDNVNGGS